MGRKGVTYEEKQKLSGVERSGSDALILMVAAGVLLSGQRAVSFRADGYVLDTAKQDDDTLEVVTDQFVAGSSWHTNSMGTISLKDLEGQTFQVE